MLERAHFNKNTAFATSFDVPEIHRLYVKYRQEIHDKEKTFRPRNLSTILFKSNEMMVGAKEKPPVAHRILTAGIQRLEKTENVIAAPVKDVPVAAQPQPSAPVSTPTYTPRGNMWGSLPDEQTPPPQAPSAVPASAETAGTQPQAVAEPAVVPAPVERSNVMKEEPPPPPVPKDSDACEVDCERPVDRAYTNILFRLLIWHDMGQEMLDHKDAWPVGFSFGRPLRSRSLEIMDWGTTEWHYNGWIGAHNSYFNMIYRGGVAGLLIVAALFYYLVLMVRFFLRRRSLVGIGLCAILVDWFVAANFLLIFEVPYTAIPIWTIYGLTLAYYEYLKKKTGK